jgi:nucleotide-binding universal stress UspA family protein
MTESAIAHWSNPQVILVATNLLEEHRLMLHATYQARLSNAKILLVHVAPPSYLRNEAHDDISSIHSSPLLGNVKKRLDDLVNDFQREGIECEPIVLKGLPDEQISLLVKSRSVDRVIVATRNATGVSRLVEDSVAERLIAGLEVPVCIIGRRTHPGAACGTPLGRILFSTSFEANDASAARFASTLAEAHHSQLTLLHVLDTVGMSDQERELARYMAHRRLSALVPREARHRHQPLCLVREGEPATIIVDEAGSMSQNLLILGSPYPSVLSWLLGTSLVHQVVAESQCPVITIRPNSATEFLQDTVDLTDKLAHLQGDVEATVANH